MLGWGEGELVACPGNGSERCASCKAHQAHPRNAFCQFYCSEGGNTYHKGKRFRCQLVR